MKNAVTSLCSVLDESICFARSSFSSSFLCSSFFRAGIATRFPVWPKSVARSFAHSLIRTGKEGRGQEREREAIAYECIRTAIALCLLHFSFTLLGQAALMTLSENSSPLFAHTHSLTYSRFKLVLGRNFNCGSSLLSFSLSLFPFQSHFAPVNLDMRDLFRRP